MIVQIEKDGDDYLIPLTEELLKASICDVYDQLLSRQQSLGDEINSILSQNISKLYLADHDDLWD